MNTDRRETKRDCELSSGRLAMTDTLFKALSDPNRRYLLGQLRNSPMTVNEMAESLPISRPAVSQHLKALLDAKLVSVQSSGTRRIYTINNSGFHRLQIWIDEFDPKKNT